MSDLEVELTVSAHQLAGLYRMYGWQLIQSKESTPTAVELSELIGHVSRESLENGAGSYYSLGRLIGIRDAEFPDVVELSLFIGTARYADDSDPDAPPPANRFTGHAADWAHDILTSDEGGDA